MAHLVRTGRLKRETKIVKANRYKPNPSKFVQVARSFSYKLNMGSGTFESRDFFCSQTAECLASEVDKVSEAVHQFCKREVLRDVAAYKAELKAAEDRDRQTINERKATLQRDRLESVRPGGM